MELELIAKILEVAMYILFGCSWPFNIIKSIKTKSTHGKSLLFLVLIDLGYVASMASKLIGYDKAMWASSWWVFMCVCINFVLVSIDLILYFINLKIEKSQLNTKQIA